METNILWLDHSFVLLIAVAYPLAGYLSFRRLLKRVAAGETVNRLELYRNTLIGHWALFLILATIWIVTARPWPAIGFGLETDPWFAVSAVLAVLGIGALAIQGKQVRDASQEEIDKLSKRLGKLSIIIPHNGSELARFYGLSVTAGIVEEILWRGFMIWYLNHFMPLWAAALLSAIGFVLAHAYQGIDNMPQITAVSAVLTALYLLSGTIWIPILLHAAIDILQGRLAYDVSCRSGIGSEVTDAP